MPEAKESHRLPPGQFATRVLPVSHIGTVPYFDPATWNLRIYGLVETPRTIDHGTLSAMPRHESRTDLHCVTTWSSVDSHWEGVSCRRLLLSARPLPEARHVLVHADGGYSTNLPLEALLADDALLADQRNGEPLPPEQGFPARLIVPDRYAYKCAKWVRAFELLAEDHPGFWESRGFSSTADPWAEDRFA